MNLKRIQTYQDPEVIAVLSRYAKTKGLSLARVLRRAAEMMKNSPDVRVVEVKKNEKHPLSNLVGLGKGTYDASKKADEIYE